MIGRRLADTRLGYLPDDVQPGDIWRYTTDDGHPIVVRDEPTNLTGTMWGFCDPLGHHGTLRKHTVREHEDGSITVAPNDGSSNSILNTGKLGEWHGYIEAGTVWREV